MHKSIFFRVILMTLFVAFAANGQESYEEWLKKDQQAFEDYLSETDKAFTQFLKENWVNIDSEQPIKIDPKPKPQKQPVLPQTKPTTKPEKPLDIKPKTPKPKPEPVQKERPKPVIEEPPAPVPAVKTFEFRLFELPYTLPYAKPIALKNESYQNKASIAADWQSCSAWQHQDIVREMYDFAKKKELNDWSTYQLAHAVAKKVPGVKTHQQGMLVTWFFMSKLGYDVKIAFGGNDLYLLIPMSEQLFSVSYFPMQKKRYYLFKGTEWINSVPKIRTYPKTYTANAKILSASLKQMPQFTGRVAEKRNKNSTVKIARDAIFYGNTLPQTELTVYFNTPMSAALNNSLSGRFAPSAGTKIENLNKVLAYIQHGFDYQTDQEQFGRERALYPDETFYYPYADCEDRSILFARIMKEIYGYDVIGLDYPGHIAAAVHVPGNTSGDAVLYNGKRYIICDPTYINAKAGMCMPQFKTTSPGVIVVN
jgi:hypothetical protein